MPKFILLLLGVLSGLLQFNSCRAMVNTESTNYAYPLSKYMTKTEAMVLRNAYGHYDLSFPISDRVNPLSANLKLVLSNSNALKGNRSQLIVYVNDFLVGQTKLDPVNNNSEIQFKIEPELLRNGYNTLSFRAAQHYTDTECEDWSAPELWTAIDTQKSSLSLQVQPEPIIEKLSELDTLINDHLPHYSLTILRAEETVSDPYLYWGAMIAQAAKLRLKYVPLTLDEKYVLPFNNAEDSLQNRFHINPALLNSDAVLIGTKQQIADLLPDSLTQAIQGAYLGIFRQPEHPDRFILVLSGTSIEEVNRAVQAFAALNMPLPDAGETLISEIQIPLDPAFVTDNLVLPEHTYQFAQLNFDARPLTPLNTRSKLEFRLPADLYATEDKVVKLNLNLAYGASFEADMVINLNLNNTFMHAIHLKEHDGAHYKNYQIELPLRSFKPGANILEFNYLNAPSQNNQCLSSQNPNLLAQIYADSVISFPDAGHFSVLPDLELLSKTGFPFIRNASWAETSIKLLDTSSDSITSAWLLIANLAANQQTPIFELKITQNDIPNSGNLILIGKNKHKPELSKLFTGAPFDSTSPNSISYLFKQSQLKPGESAYDWVERVIFGIDDLPKSVRIENQNTRITQSAGLGEKYLLMSYPNQLKDGIVLALLSESENPLYPGVEMLFSKGLWGQMQGNLFVWDKDQRYKWLQQGETINFGTDSFSLGLIGHFSKHAWQWLILILTLVVVAAWLIHKMLTRYQSRIN